jgi:hypothetical protein
MSGLTPPMPKISITRHLSCRDPELHHFRVEIKNDTGVWEDAWGSEAELRAYLRGLEAMAGMLQRFLTDMPEIPRNVTEDEEEAEHA